MQARAQKPEPGVRSNTALAFTSCKRAFQSSTVLRSCQKSGTPNVESKISSRGLFVLLPSVSSLFVAKINGIDPHGAVGIRLYVLSCVDSSPAAVNSCRADVWN